MGMVFLIPMALLSSPSPSAQLAYQREIYEATAFTRCKAGGSLGDQRLYQQWHASSIVVPGWILWPISWRCVSVFHGVWKGDPPMMTKTLELLSGRDRRYRHALLMMQADVSQTIIACQRMRVPVQVDDVFGPDVVVFDSRLMTMWFAAHQEGARPWNATTVPVPLVNGLSTALAARSATSECEPMAYWRGSCHGARIRGEAFRRLGNATGYRLDVAACHDGKGSGPMLSKDAWVKAVVRGCWTLVPRGSYPAAFSMYEVIALGRLPVYISDWRLKGSHLDRGWFAGSVAKADHRDGQPLTQAEMFEHMPYSDVLDWSRLALAVDGAQLERLGAILAEAQPRVPAMLEYAASVRPLFTITGLSDYIQGWLQKQ